MSVEGSERLKCSNPQCEYLVAMNSEKILGRSGRWAAAGGWICWSPFGAYRGEGVISRGIHIGLEDEGFDIAKV